MMPNNTRDHNTPSNYATSIFWNQQIYLREFLDIAKETGNEFGYRAEKGKQPFSFLDNKKVLEEVYFTF